MSSNNFSALLRALLKNKKITLELLQNITKFKITEFEFEDIKNMNDGSGYDFSVIKFKIFIPGEKEKNLYIKMIKKDKIKESIFCYWSLLYNEMFKNYEESEFTSIINKVRITETENEEYKHSVLLEIQENKWGILESGSTIHLVKLEKYLNSKAIKLSKEWKKSLKDENQEVLFIGIIN